MAAYRYLETVKLLTNGVMNVPFLFHNAIGINFAPQYTNSQQHSTNEGCLRIYGSTSGGVYSTLSGIFYTNTPITRNPEATHAKVTVDYSQRIPYKIGTPTSVVYNVFSYGVGNGAKQSAGGYFTSIPNNRVLPPEFTYDTGRRQDVTDFIKIITGVSNVTASSITNPSFNAGGNYAIIKDSDCRIYNISVEVYAENKPPTTPTDITTVGNQAGKPAATTVTTSTDADGDPISYVWEQRSDTGAYAQIGITTNPTITYNVPTVGTTFTRRCKAVDDQGGESTYATGVDMLIDYNLPPTITDTDRDLGTFAESPPAWAGNATDPEGKALTAVIRLDNEVLQTASGTGAISLSLAAIDHDKWIRIPNGNHTITIAATDDKSAQAVRKLTFVKRENQFEFYRGQSTHQRPSKALISVSPNKSTWADGTVQLWVTNNGNDPADQISWVQVPLASIGDSANAALAVDLLNEVKVAENWCLALHMKAVEGMSGAALTTDMLTINVSIELVIPPTP